MELSTFDPLYRIEMWTNYETKIVSYIYLFE